ncbi:MAG: hypothetical protein FRX49_11629 [Trebouxia sp. A1-2]|nr:MAG: hypothetical protein FRX49_11629 [Trebouxia sp. A1-2]
MLAGNLSEGQRAESDIFSQSNACSRNHGLLAGSLSTVMLAGSLSAAMLAGSLSEFQLVEFDIFNQCNACSSITELLEDSLELPAVLDDLLIFPCKPAAAAAAAAAPAAAAAAATVVTASSGAADIPSYWLFVTFTFAYAYTQASGRAGAPSYRPFVALDSTLYISLDIPPDLDTKPTEPGLYSLQATMFSRVPAVSPIRNAPACRQGIHGLCITLGNTLAITVDKAHMACSSHSGRSKDNFVVLGSICNELLGVSFRDTFSNDCNDSYGWLLKSFHGRLIGTTEPDTETADDSWAPHRRGLHTKGSSVGSMVGSTAGCVQADIDSIPVDRQRCRLEHLHTNQDDQRTPQS